MKVYSDLKKIEVMLESRYNEDMKTILSYIVFLQLHSFLSIGIAFLIFWIGKQFFSMDVSRIRSFFDRWTSTKILIVLLLLEITSLMMLLPVANWWFRRIGSAYSSVLLVSFPVLSVIAVLIKFYSVKKMVKKEA